ncbi:hypothetical protein FJZ26_05550 [Candidatus Parvarchaeota archaeon]|nr:hypothetical protein [Candidatus Parvarchaeota archaeon]
MSEKWIYMSDAMPSSSGRRGFVFSLDAFVALSLVLVAIYSLFVLVLLPKSYYSTYQQGYSLARDTLNSLDHLKYASSEQTYLEFFAAGGASPIVHQKIRENVGPLIPQQYGFRIERSTSAGGWDVIYDTAIDTLDTTHNKEYRKLSVSAQSLVSGYATPPQPANPPDCGQVQSSVICAVEPGITADTGTPLVTVVRLTVYI